MKLIPLLLGLGITSSLSAATERMCFGQAPIEATTDLIAKITIAESELFTIGKCAPFFPYYAKHVNFSAAECDANKDQLSLDKGYAPFGVFLRGTDSTGKDNIVSYDWEIKDLSTDAIITTLNGFNAAHIFDQPGEYSATLTITDKGGASSSDTRNITVWPRDGESYYVDSDIGDDRYNGLTQSPDNTCDANVATLGSCNGPWKTATRAFGELSPYNATTFSDGKYTADSICLKSENIDVTRYNQGNFKIFRSSTFLESEAKKDADGNYLPAITTEICTSLATKRTSVLKPGDQILFHTNQTFDIETGIQSLSSYSAINDGITYQYERLDTYPITTVTHWSTAIGVNFSSYGEGTKPIIKNTGKSSNQVVFFQGVGMFGFSISDLDFDLLSNQQETLSARATLMEMREKPINMSFQRINVKNMQQGIIGNAKDGSGLFIFNSEFSDSTITQLFTQSSYKDVAIVNNTYDYSANHLIYSSIASGLVVNNKLSRPAYGRTAFRLSGGTFNNANRNVWISDNEITGWVDPRTSAEFGAAFSNGERYNYTLVDIAPNVFEDLALYDIVFTRNKVIDAETLLEIGDGENITISYNLFKSADSERSSRIHLNKNTSKRPLKNIDIINNTFIDLAPSVVDNSVRSFISLDNYYQDKCSEQFNHENINIESNSFYTPHNQSRIFGFPLLTQGKDILGNTLPNLTLQQAESFVSSQVILNNNTLFSPNKSTPTIQIGGDFRAGNPDLTSTDWTQFYQGISSSGGEFRLYTGSSLTLIIGTNLWDDSNNASIDGLIADINNASIGSTTPVPPLSWEEVVAFAQENNVTPAELESLILNQVLAANPTYSGLTSKYSEESSIFEKMDDWLFSIPNAIASLFSNGGEENKWSDAKKLASNNNISTNKVMLTLKTN